MYKNNVECLNGVLREKVRGEGEAEKERSDVRGSLLLD